VRVQVGHDRAGVAQLVCCRDELRVRPLALEVIKIGLLARPPWRLGLYVGIDAGAHDAGNAGTEPVR